jgi:hypothetical protein
MLDVLIGGNKYVEPRGFRLLEEFAIFELRMPLHLDKSPHIMFEKEAPHADRDVLIEDDSQRGDS